jgi:drug/metabolite transporter (DMT)-like permease
LILLFALLGFSDEPRPGARVWALASLAGAIGSAGLMLLYHYMTRGLMSIATPVSSLLAAVLPVAVGLLRDGSPGPASLAGFGFALLAVWLISQGEGSVTDIPAHISDLKLPLLAGVGFGLYFIIIHEATRDGAALWAMIASRSGGSLIVILYMLIGRASWKAAAAAWPLIGLNAAFDLLGNGFFILAGQAGRLDVAAVLSSLFPGATVLLAWLFLRERLSRNQWAGILSALVAIALMTI